MNKQQGRSMERKNLQKNLQSKKKIRIGRKIGEEDEDSE